MRAAWAVVVLSLALRALAIATAGTRTLRRMVPDDAFYYLQVGQRIAAGQGSTFDGVHPTNGYHPLWEGIVSLLARTASGDGLVRLTLLVGLALVAIALVLTARLLSGPLGPLPVAVGAALFVRGPLGVATTSNGMEGSVALLAWVLLAWSLQRAWQDGSTRRDVAVGLAMALVVLSRVDSVLVVWLVPVVLARHRRSWVALRSGLVAALAVLPVALASAHAFGRWVPASAAVRRAVVDPSFTAFPLHSTVGWIGYRPAIGLWVGADLLRNALTANVGGRALGAVVGVVVLVVATGALLMWRKPGPVEVPSELRPVLLVGALVVGDLAVNVVTVPGPWLLEWYAGPALAVVAFAMGWVVVTGLRMVVTHVHNRPLLVAGASLLLLLAIPAASASIDGTPASTTDAKLAAVAWIGAHGPPGRYGANDAGIVGFGLMGDRQVVNLDGFVGGNRVADLAAHRAPLEQRARAGGASVFVGRLIPADQHLLDCGKVLWRWPHLLDGDPYVVLDLAPCR